MRLLSIIIILLALPLTHCTTRSSLTPGEGFVDVKGGKVWYSVSGSGDKTPLVLLHGGPGATSSYLMPLLPLAEDRPVIRFDQLGCGNSDRITDTTLMTIDNYIDQVNAVLKKLNVTEYYLYGHSWGTMLGIDFYTKHPEGVKKLILASPCLSAPMWVADADTLIASLDDSTKAILRRNIRGIAQDSAKLAAAINDYASHFYTRRPVTPAAKTKATESGTNVYVYMWGTSEFFATGTLKTFDRTRALSKINIPTLYITGEYDAARPTTVRYYQSLTPGAKLTIISQAGHSTMNDNPKEDIEAIRAFLE